MQGKVPLTRLVNKIFQSDRLKNHISLTALVKNSDRFAVNTCQTRISSAFELIQQERRRGVRPIHPIVVAMLNGHLVSQRFRIWFRKQKHRLVLYTSLLIVPNNT